MQAVTAKGQTPASNGVNDICTAIGNIASGKQVIDLGTGTSFDVSSYDGYQNFTKDNFIIQMVSVSNYENKKSTTINSTGTYYFSQIAISVTKTYTASTGKLSAKYTITNKYGTHMASTPSVSATKNVNVRAYLVI